MIKPIQSFLDPKANFFQQLTILLKLKVNTTYTTFNSNNQKTILLRIL